MRATLLALLLAAGGRAPQESGSDASGLIDVHLTDLWKEHGVSRAAHARDGEFLRRLCIDLVGEVPTPAEVREFQNSELEDKHRRKIDELLRSPWFAHSWAERMTNFLLGYARQFDYFTDRKGMTRWLMDRLKNPKARWDDIARDILTARSEGGDTYRATGFFTQFAEFKDEEGYGLRIEQLAGRAATSFLGIRLQCAQCHDHPADTWTQEDFRGVAAYFTRTSFGQDPGSGLALADRAKPLKYSFDGLQGELKPRFLDGGEPATGEWRADFAQRVTAHPLFARAFVNRAWAWFFGRGFVEPLDDMHEGRKPVAPALLDALAKDFADHHFDIRHLVRSICASDAYSLTSRRSEGDDEAAEKYFARARIRPMTPEQLFQSTSRATDLLDSHQDDDAILELLGGQNQTGEEKKYYVVRRWFIDMLVKTSDEAATTNFSAYTANIQQVLTALNQELPLFAGAKAGAGGRLQKLIGSGSDTEVVAEIFLATVSRLPTPREQKRCLDHVRDAGTRTKGFEEVFWSLLNTDEFIFNH
jgi:hypothetical protein